ncbi:MAG: ECF transporter S component [Clostridia bacterium]|nr:ECF transporter S component [Clostridia bacterium]
MKRTTNKIVLASMLSALVFILTRVISVPTVTAVGNVNLGDCAVLLCGWLLPCRYAFLSAGIGSALADLLSPYAIYTPATFLIKGLMAVIVSLLLNRSKGSTTVKTILSGIVAELVMIAGYLVFEGVFICGFKTAILNIPFNAVQGTVGLVAGVLLFSAFRKINKK